MMDKLHKISGACKSLRSCVKMCLATLLGIFCLVCVSAINDPGRLGASVRLPASQRLRAPSPEEMPAPIENEGDSARVWAVRAKASRLCIAPGLAAASQFFRDAAALARSGSPQPRLRILTPLLAQDGATPPGLLASAPEYADVLDARGRPLRWHMPDNILAAYSLPRRAAFAPLRQGGRGEEQQPKGFERALARLAPTRNAAAYRDLVESFASRYGLSTELVMAIIHSESNFAPNIVSKRSAMGLMQLLPSTASDEVHRFLYGRRGSVSYAQLSQPEINIRYGTAYLHILNKRYFANVRDKQVREACVIASYNLGPNRFLKLYGGNNQSAVDRINSMTPEEFHRDLPRRLPVRETRFYVEKVKRMKQHYSQ